ncbi:hypothetical protein DB88DRAFT_47358 [Papiliotrema laurentii]|uniref:Uncharacterized protein n=1 Tax=Papiliotrema laurentii TaxID=5418 RepID=A0AAD9FWY8_PAPLA|nr:hypothetical protein DB88DRAFT_47358 [Papiliotrema laurentii]
MAPRRSSRTTAKTESKGEKRKHEEVDAAAEEQTAEENASPEGKLENADPEPPAKTSRTSMTPLDWLLSDEAFDLANPEIPEGHGEIDWDESQQRKTPPDSDVDQSKKENEDVLRYPQSSLTPFQNLVSASILSKPLSHKLGLRTIQTLLNPPFSLRTWKDLDEAGYEGRRKVMWEARTQHKEKTASLLGDLCDGIKELCGEDEEDLSELQGVRDKIDGMKHPKEAQETVEKVLTKIKGIGPGVAGIFLRRVQREWQEVFPYIDERSLKAARAFGLVGERGGADELKQKTGGDREKFVRVVDVLVGLELEKRWKRVWQWPG